MDLSLQKVIPAIENYKTLKLFLKSDIEYCVLLDFQLVELDEIIFQLKQQNKKILIHIDLIKGLTPNEFGAIYLIQKLKVDGIISTKNSAVVTAKKRGIISVQRIFLKDTLSLNKSLQVVEKVQPDYLEILPAISTAILPKIVKSSHQKVICGGLIQSKKEIDNCLNNGAIGVTTSNPKFWD
jgi:glycerol uptake operon antiterminator